jgi:hypothetical protein
MRIVGVHGVGNHQPGQTPAQAADALSKNWAEALCADLPAVDLCVAYYAHHLRPVAAQSVDDIDQLDAEEAEFVLAWATALGAPEELRQGPATVPLRHLADWVARRYGQNAKLVRWFVALFFREVATYLRATGSAARMAARDEVVALLETHRPRVVIAHSLGSVVAYEALAARPDLRVDLLITLGSPLAMPDVVYPRLHPQPGLPGRLPGASRWINIADVGDLVAVPRRLGGRFATDADYEETIGLFDFHRVRRYLASDRVRRVLVGRG